jgi:hypothetical protein
MTLFINSVPLMLPSSSTNLPSDVLIIGILAKKNFWSNGNETMQDEHINGILSSSEFATEVANWSTSSKDRQQIVFSLHMEFRSNNNVEY